MKSFFRFLCRNRLYSLINFGGLTVSLAVVVIILSYAIGQYGISRTYAGRNLYGIYYNGELMSCPGMGPRLEGLPQVKEAVRFTAVMPNTVVKCGDKAYSSTVMAADSPFFRMFAIDVLSGDPAMLADRSCVFLSESFAARTFPGTDPRGHEILVNGDQYTVEGIVEDFGDGILQYADLVGSMSGGIPGPFADDSRPFGVFGPIMTFAEIPGDMPLAELEDMVNRLFGDIGYMAGNMTVVPADRIYFSDGNVYLDKGNRKLVSILLAAGIALLLSAVINYVNLNTALVGKRSREMAMRVLLGSGRRNMTARYIGESVIFTGICFAAAIPLAAAMTPAVNNLIYDPVYGAASARMRISDIFAPWSMASYLLVFAAVALAAGIVPAWIASRVRPVDIVRGTMRLRSKQVFSKIFIVAQNIISVVLAAVAITMEAQMKHMTDRPVGCNTEDLYYLSPDFGEADADLLLERLRELPCVSAAGICNSLPGAMAMSYTSENIITGDEVTYYVMECDTCAFNMLGFGIEERYGDNLPGSMWITASGAGLAGLGPAGRDAVESSFVAQGFGERLSGVVSDFIIRDPGYVGKADAGLVHVVDDIEWKNILLRTAGGHDEASAAITGAYNEFCTERFGAPVTLWENGYMEDYIARSLSGAKHDMRLVELFMVVAILLSLSGIVAVSIYYTDLNVKGIMIRKVFGATSGSETVRNLRLYVALTLAADAVAVPLAVFLCRRYLEEFSYRAELSPWIFVLTAVLSLAVTVLSVIRQVSRAAGTNPVEAMKAE